MSASKPEIARYRPWYYKVVPGKRYFWCACGRSKNQPFCDGSHKGTGIEPLLYQPGENEHEVLFCGCKYSGAKPLCDGSHNNLRDSYEQDDPLSVANREIARVTHARDGRLELNGRCYVTSEQRLESRQEGNLKWTELISARTGAWHQSLYGLEVSSGQSPNITVGASQALLLVRSGQGQIQIGDRQFELSAVSGVSVMPGESFHIDCERPLHLYLSVLPQIDVFQPGKVAASGDFDAAYPSRRVAVDPDLNQRLGDRAFQVLINKVNGSHKATQFIGNIPPSKARPHRHLYEESLIVMSGTGCLWTEDLKVDVHPGDVIFLPAQQVHSLQCTEPAGMVVAGVIYPGGNPDINY